MKYEKKGFELGINFIVILILSIFIFGMGLKITKDMFIKSTDSVNNIDQIITEEISKQLRAGKIISLGIDRATVDSGKRTIFRVGMINRYGKSINYKIKFEEEVYSWDTNNKEIILDEQLSNISKWTFRELNMDTLEANEEKTIHLIINVPKNAKEGLYTLTLRTYYNTSDDTLINEQDNIFGNQPLKIYLEVR